MAYQNAQNSFETETSPKGKNSLWRVARVIFVPALLSAGFMAIDPAPEISVKKLPEKAPAVKSSFEIASNVASNIAEKDAPCKTDPTSFVCMFRGNVPVYFH